MKTFGWPRAVAAALVLAGLVAAPAVAADPGWSGPQVVEPVTADPGSALSCPSVTTCRTAGPTGASATFDGSAWAPAVNAAHNFGSLGDLSCPTDEDCVAVGGRRIVRRDSSGWGPVRLAPVALARVSCASTTLCVATSAHGDRVVRWDGHTWSSTVLPHAHRDLAAVSCAAGRCLAVARGRDSWRYDGSAWHHLRLPRTGRTPDAPVVDVSCPTRRRCTVVTADHHAARWRPAGWQPWAHLDAHTTRPVTALDCATRDYCVVADAGGGLTRWHDSRWHQRNPVADHALHDIACPRVGACYVTTDTASIGWVDGVRHRYPFPVVQPADRSMGVDCVSATWCMAVDGQGGSFTYDGTAWHAQPGPAPRYGRWPAETPVSCPTTTFCLAVDDVSDHVWNGSTWSESRDPVGPLRSISCASPSFCVAVEANGSGLLVWHGDGWSGLPVDSDVGFLAVDCPDADRCVALDFLGRVRSYDGAGWSDPQKVLSAAVTGLSCPTTAFCMATDRFSMVTMHDGRWSARTPVDVSGQVSCDSATSCELVRGNQSRHWDGSHFSAKQALWPPAYELRPQALSCAPDLCVVVDSAVSAVVRR